MTALLVTLVLAACASMGLMTGIAVGLLHHVLTKRSLEPRTASRLSREG